MKNISLVGTQKVRNHALNSSTSKLTYSFSRQERFRSCLPNCPSVSYENKGQLSKRSAGFGVGERSDFTKNYATSPAPDRYNPEETTLSTKKSSPFKSFGIHREKSPEFGIIKRGALKNPGVGAYDVKLEPVNNFSYTMRSRTLDVILKNNSSKASPGPVAYQHRDQFPLDKFYSSKYENPPLGKLSKTARFMNVKLSPGPQAYQVSDSLSNQGKYVSSKHLSDGNRKFSLSSRAGFTDQFAKNKSLNPGPGSYNRYSQFGQSLGQDGYKTFSSLSKTGGSRIV